MESIQDMQRLERNLGVIFSSFQLLNEHINRLSSAFEVVQVKTSHGNVERTICEERKKWSKDLSTQVQLGEGLHWKRQSHSNVPS